MVVVGLDLQGLQNLKVDYHFLSGLHISKGHLVHFLRLLAFFHENCGVARRNGIIILILRNFFSKNLCFNNKISDRDGILERMENQIEKLQKKNVKSSGYGLASVSSNKYNSSRSPQTRRPGVSPT